MRGAEGARAVVRVVRAEGFAAVRDRLWDRARDAAVRARCVRDDRSAWPAAAVLNVIGVPMTTAFGGVPLQLRARLGRESLLRTVALLSREPRRNGHSDWRLESWTDGRPRRAMTFPAGDWDGDPLRDDPAVASRRADVRQPRERAGDSYRERGRPLACRPRGARGRRHISISCGAACGSRVPHASRASRSLGPRAAAASPPVSSRPLALPPRSAPLENARRWRSVRARARGYR